MDKPWYDKPPVVGKSMMDQIETHVPGTITRKEFLDMLKKMQDEGRRRAIEREKQIKENIKHIVKREKELGKKAPIEFVLRVTMDPTPYVGSDFLEKYKEWL